MKKGLLHNVLVFLIVFMGLNMIFNSFNGSNTTSPENDGLISLKVEKEIEKGHTVQVTIKNNTKESLTIPHECPNEPLIVTSYQNGDWKPVTASPDIDCTTHTDFVVPSQGSITIPYEYWSKALFKEGGRYKIGLTTTLEGQQKTIESNEFEIVQPSLLNLVWGSLLYQPIFNALIFLTSVTPGHNLGIAIILLTLLIRTLLLAPSHKAMRAQKRMQEIQPKLDEIRKKYKDNQEKVAQETMKIWKEYKVNPFGSCLPLLIQFPILIALFYVVQSGLNPDHSELLYGTLKEFSFQKIDTSFLGGLLDLTKINTIGLPLVVGLLQFTQMKMSLSKQKKRGKKNANVPSEMQMANNMMIYFLPVMIAVFTASVPAGVGVYWGTSTLYGIAQQFVINREKPESTPKVKVLN